MNKEQKDKLVSALEAKDVLVTSTVQELWGGYGSILKVDLVECAIANKALIKHINPSSKTQHPRAWDTTQSHLRKLTSYKIETSWYENYAGMCDSLCKVPHLYTSLTIGDDCFLVMEDLDELGYNARMSRLNSSTIGPCIDWLANFHARFMGMSCDDLWEKGSYWHLDTRMDEWNVMAPGNLKEAAHVLDKELDSCQFKTIIHGDAKVANFCFDMINNNVAAVDFQYVGRGCGMKDLSYFIGSCLSSEECFASEKAVLNRYFDTLKTALDIHGFKGSIKDLEEEWRSLYPIAWADFNRFLMGWAPDHAKLNDYSEKMTRKALVQ